MKISKSVVERTRITCKPEERAKAVDYMRTQGYRILFCGHPLNRGHDKGVNTFNNRVVVVEGQRALRKETVRPVITPERAEVIRNLCKSNRWTL